MFKTLRKTLKEATAPLVNNIGTFGVAYGPQTAETLTANASGMEAVAVEPGFYSAPPLPHAYAYVPLSGFHSDNLAHRPLLAGVEQADGFLYDPTGIKLSDPHGAGTKLINYRKQPVRALMRRYIEERIAEGYRGFFLDAIDSFTLAEKLAPYTEGSARAAADFVEETIPMLRAMGADVIVNGGLYATKATDIIPMIGRCGAAIGAEHQYTDGKGKLRGPGETNWTKARLAVFATAAASEGHKARVYFIEGPVARKDLAAAYRDGARWAETLLLPIKRKLMATPFEYGLYFTENNNYRELTKLP